MKITDLKFTSESCCGLHTAATVDLGNGKSIGVIPRDDGLYNLTYYNAQGLERRESGLTANQVESVLPKT